MKIWKTAALAAALTAAAGAGAAVMPVAEGQTARVVSPQGIEILNAGRGSRLGVTVRDVETADAKGSQPAGVIIDSVTDGSAAGRAGLQKGDVVVEFDGERVRSVRQFTRLVQESVAGRPVNMAVLRNGQRQTLNISPEEGSGLRVFGDDWVEFSDSLRGLGVAPPRPPAPPEAPAPPAPSWDFPESFIWRGGHTLGITLNELSPQLAEYFGTKEGVLVTSVREGSAADRMGLKAGDIVTSVNGAAVSTASQLRRETQRLASGAEFTLGLTRDRKPLTLKGKTEERREQRRTFRTVV
jgi:serine protease Do